VLHVQTSSLVSLYQLYHPDQVEQGWNCQFKACMWLQHMGILQDEFIHHPKLCGLDQLGTLEVF